MGAIVLEEHGEDGDVAVFFEEVGRCPGGFGVAVWYGKVLYLRDGVGGVLGGSGCGVVDEEGAHVYRGEGDFHDPARNSLVWWMELAMYLGCKGRLGY